MLRSVELWRLRRGDEWLAMIARVVQQRWQSSAAGEAMTVGRNAWSEENVAKDENAEWYSNTALRHVAFASSRCHGAIVSQDEDCCAVWLMKGDYVTGREGQGRRHSTGTRWPPDQQGCCFATHADLIAKLTNHMIHADEVKARVGTPITHTVNNSIIANSTFN